MTGRNTQVLRSSSLGVHVWVYPEQSRAELDSELKWECLQFNTRTVELKQQNEGKICKCIQYTTNMFSLFIAAHFHQHKMNGENAPNQILQSNRGPYLAPSAKRKRVSAEIFPGAILQFQNNSTTDQKKTWSKVSEVLELFIMLF